MTTCNTEKAEYVGIYEATDFCERDTKRLRERLNGNPEIEQVHEIVHIIPFEMKFSSFKESVRQLFPALESLKKDLEKELGKKLYCLSVDFSRLGFEYRIPTMAGIKFKFTCKFLEQGDLK